MIEKSISTICLFTEDKWKRQELGDEYFEKLSIDGVCYKYRLYYKTLWQNKKNPRLLSFVMLNPSLASQYSVDCSVSNCIKIAKDENFDGIEVLNVYSLRHPKYKKFKSYVKTNGNPKNLNYDFAELKNVVLAWGSEDVYNSILFKEIRDKAENLYRLVVKDKGKIAQNYNYNEKALRHPNNMAWTKLGGISNAKLLLINKKDWDIFI